jgi:hypothetical protein
VVVETLDDVTLFLFDRSSTVIAASFTASRVEMSSEKTLTLAAMHGSNTTMRKIEDLALQKLERMIHHIVIHLSMVVGLVQELAFWNPGRPAQFELVSAP